MTDPVPSKDLLQRLRAISDGGIDFDCEITDHTRKEMIEVEQVCHLAVIEIESLRSRVNKLTVEHAWAVGQARAAHETKPPHLREPPHCSTCACGLAPEPRALHREQVKAICHALSGCCVMVTDPDRPLCSVETCLAMEAAVRAAQPPSADDLIMGRGDGG